MNTVVMNATAPALAGAPGTETAPRATTRALQVLLGLALLLVAAPITLAVAVLNIDGDTRALKNAIIAPDPEKWQKQIELDLGRAPFLLARMAAPMIPDLPEEGRAALSAVKDAEFSIYQLKGDFPDTAKLLASSDERMIARGYDRIVGVLEHDVLVAVYLHSKSQSIDNLRVSVVVLADRQLITVSAKADLDAVMNLALREAEKRLPKRE